MTIASEITRLQGAKADIRQAIIDKGVDVPASDNIDCYACCINDIPTGSGGKFVDVLLVGAGGYGGCCGAGGGGGGVVCLERYQLKNDNELVMVGPMLNTTFGDKIAFMGGSGKSCSQNQPCISCGGQGGSGGGGGSYYGGKGGSPRGMQGYEGGGNGFCGNTSIGGYGGGGGAGGAGCDNYQGSCYNQCRVGLGGRGIQTDFSGKVECFAGGGSSWNSIGASAYSGKDVLTNPPLTCGTGGSGYNNSCYKCGQGAGGVVIIRYPNDGSYGIDSSEGGCKYVCNGYVYHCFTQSGIFKTKTVTGCNIVYLAVGGGGGGSYYGGGGGGGAVCIGETPLSSNSICIKIGAGGCGTNGTTGCNGGDTCIGDIVIAKGGQGGQCKNGGCSGSGKAGGLPANWACYQGGGGGGAGGIGYNVLGDYSLNYAVGGDGGKGILGFGGGGGGRGYNRSWDGNGIGVDGGADGYLPYVGSHCRSASSCGGGGGGGWDCASCCQAKGCKGTVCIFYPDDGSYGFTSATGGDRCMHCGNICIHQFFNDGTFTITG